VEGKEKANMIKLEMTLQHEWNWCNPSHTVSNFGLPDDWARMLIAEKMAGKSQAKFTVEQCPNNKTKSAQTLNHRTN
jgi:hypothetical protein